MSLRKEVFQAKVLQRLYPAPPNPEKVLDSAVHHPETFKSSNTTKPKTRNTTANIGAPTSSGRKVYTALPPPQDYVPAHGDGSATPSRPEPVDNANEATSSDDHSGPEDEGHVRKRRKRRRKQKAAGLSETPGGDAEGPEHLSRNKKRKLKKKRHREKLRTLVPRPAALEFTYKHTEEEEEEGGDEEQLQKVEDVLEFLQSTYDLYASDRSRAPGVPSVLSVSAAKSLFANLSAGTSPPAVLSDLCRFRALLVQADTVRLHKELQEFRSGSTLPADETDLICTLFNYWITEVLPLQTEKT
ncbi:glutamate-rich protein 1 [Trichomycterus rosablanca]|uniref:glutamate-rich protein 1 n=1 Tax=Trichomycterus rosablanca TaxID=2290929 RepID=UPI002F35D81D